ncbi:MAG TPA: hypothetical protein VNW90_29370 [Acetobacteraceae bacterium]|jgi:hypothetical protein|nr:hypothetical protein [Acetobacteraceae bacterium]
MAHGTVRHLPDADRAIVEQRRIREYVLNRVHAHGGPNSRFFIVGGLS